LSPAEVRRQLASRILDQTQEGIMITDANGTIVDVNDAFVRITGYERHEAIGRDTRLLQSGAQDQAFYTTMWDQIQASGYWKGEIWNRKKSGQMFPELLSVSAVRDDAGQVEYYVGIFLDITEIKDKESELRRLAYFDGLTGLPNRTLAMDRLRQNMSRLQRNGQLLAVAYIDLDGFKEINDLVGHHGGDQILIEIAKRMKNVLRGGDSIARLGGDEFMAMLTDLRSPDDVDAFIGRFFNAIRQPIELEGKNYKLSASLGVTFYPQKQDIDAELLIRQADQAMYQSKLSGKDQYHIFDADIEAFSRGRHALIQQIRDGLRKGEFEIYYQPKVNMREGTVIGVESLLRWHHPELGLLEPAAFLPKLVGHEIEIELGWWCIDTALAQMDQWAQKNQPLPISVNVSALHLQQPQFVDALRSRILRYPALSPNSLELEILETSALTDLHRIGSLIEECAKIGVQFSVDDFGTGYSTLLMLRHLPAQFLKIDRSFVQNLLTESNDLVLMESMIALGRAFGRQVIAEGVETDLQAELLLRLGCDLAQGYCIARPMPVGDLGKWQAHWRAPHRWRLARTLDASKFKPLHVIMRHGIWVRNLKQFIEGDSALPPELISLGGDFQQELDEIGLTPQDHPLADELIRTYGRMHDLAQEIYRLIESNQLSQANSIIRELKQLSTHLLQTWLDLSDSGATNHPRP
jgi:diguanylate cyclase (GGDEF)-like protein/PAS domain S-box-containing protein